MPTIRTHADRSDTTNVESPLEKMLNRIGHSKEFPAISKYLIDINRKLSLNPDMSDASDIANVILNDYALTNKLLKLVNSAFYGVAAGTVTTITRAVVVLGYEHVRTATLGLVLFEHFQSKSNAAELKEAMIKSFWSGMLAREMAKRDDAVDPEEAFICAMMSQMGKLVMMYYLPDEYQKIVEQSKKRKRNPEKAVRLATGVSYEELGAAVARQWNFPSQICDALEKLSETQLQNKTNPPSKLCVLSSFAKELCSLIESGPLSADTPNIEQLLEQYKTFVKIKKGELNTLVHESLNEVKQHAGILKFDLSNSMFVQSLTLTVAPDLEAEEARLLALSGREGLAGESFRLTDGSALRSIGDGQGSRPPKEIIMEGIQEISEAMMANHDVNDLVLMSVEILYRSLDFNRALMFIRDHSSQNMGARFGYGADIRQLIQKVGFNLDHSKDLFNLSIQVGKDLIMADAHDEKIHHLVPAWYRKAIDAPAFIFLPITIQKVCIGAFYADRNQAGPPITEEEHRHLSLLRNQLVLAIKHSQLPR